MASAAFAAIIVGSIASRVKHAQLLIGCRLWDDLLGRGQRWMRDTGRTGSDDHDAQSG